MTDTQVLADRYFLRTHLIQGFQPYQSFKTRSDVSEYLAMALQKFRSIKNFSIIRPVLARSFIGLPYEINEFARTQIIGDSYVIIGGCFPESLQAERINRRQWDDTGKLAYDRASRLSEGSYPWMRDTLVALADGFATVEEVLLAKRDDLFPDSF